MKKIDLLTKEQKIEVLDTYEEKSALRGDVYALGWCEWMIEHFIEENNK